MTAHKTNEVRNVVGKENASVVGRTGEKGQYFTVTAFDETGRNKATKNLQASDVFHGETFWSEKLDAKYEIRVRAYSVTEAEK